MIIKNTGKDTEHQELSFIADENENSKAGLRKTVCIFYKLKQT